MGDSLRREELIGRLPEGLHNLYTLQELELQGGTEPDLDDRDIPLCVIFGELTPEEAAFLRTEIKPFPSLVARAYLNSKVDPVVNIEVLDENGRTLRYPRIGLIKEIKDQKRFIEVPEWTSSLRQRDATLTSTEGGQATSGGEAKG